MQGLMTQILLGLLRKIGHIRGPRKYTGTSFKTPKTFVIGDRITATMTNLFTRENLNMTVEEHDEK